MLLPTPRLLIALALCASACAQAADNFIFPNPPGPHAVGVKIVQQYDRTRVFKASVDLTTGEPVQGERARPIQAIVWYPAARSGKPVTYREYLDTIATEDNFTRSAAEVKRMTDRLVNDNAGTRIGAVLRDVDSPLHAVRDASAEAGKYPVVIYAPSYSSDAAENVDLCEYLASHGYIVIASASMGAHSLAMTIDQEGLEAQAADISYLIAYSTTLPQADASRVAAIGWSWGGLANVVAAAKDARIKALVSLDGSVRYFPRFVDGGKEALQFVSPVQVALPMLYVGERPMTVEALNSANMPTGYSFLNQMKYSDVYALSMLPMKHADFSSFHLRMATDEEYCDQERDYSRDEVQLAYSWVTSYTRAFLDAYLKKDAAGIAFMNNTPAANKAPPHMIAMDIRRSKGEAAPTRENFVAHLATEGFDKAIQLYDSFVAQPGAFRLDANQIESWGEELYTLNKIEQAREVFRLGIHLYPDKVELQANLGDLQAKTGQTENAVRTYRRVLELDPKNTDAVSYLKEHLAAVPGP
jgi:tetratricopeptide (TPR) repeat protein